MSLDNKTAGNYKIRYMYYMLRVRRSDLNFDCALSRSRIRITIKTGFNSK